MSGYQGWTLEEHEEVRERRHFEIRGSRLQSRAPNRKYDPVMTQKKTVLFVSET